MCALYSPRGDEIAQIMCVLYHGIDISDTNLCIFVFTFNVRKNIDSRICSSEPNQQEDIKSYETLALGEQNMNSQ